METIAHRELRNNSSDVLARVSNGETIAVTNHGKLAAILSPPADGALERARQSGSVREARQKNVRFDRLRRTRLEESTTDLLADLRGDR